jgi:hypothetical protein
VDGLPRMVVKKWIVMTLGTGGFPSRWSPEAGNDYREELGGKLGVDFPIKVVKGAVLKRHPALINLPQSGLSSLQLQYRESEVIVGTLLTLLRCHSIPSFSIHDSLLVKAKDALKASRVLRDEYFKHISSDPFLKVTATKAVWEAFSDLKQIAVEN